MSNSKASYPFYVHPMGHKRSIQIIKETKAEIKKMESLRPSTPFGRKKNEKEHLLPSSSRPSSSSSLNSLKFEEECCLSSRKLYPLTLQKGKETNPNDLKLEPLVIKSLLSSRKNFSPLLKSENQSDVSFPPIAYDENAKGDLKNVENCHKHEVSLQTIENDVLVDACNNVICCKFDNAETVNPVFISSLTDELTEKLEKDNEVFSQEVKHILFVLDKNVKLGSRKSEEDHLSIIHKLDNILKQKNALQTVQSQRVPLLKHLFKLLDQTSPVLSLHTINILFKMKIRDKNLGTVYRLMSRIIKSQNIDLQTYELIDPLLETLHEIPIQGNKETIMQGLNVLKSLIFQNGLDEKYLGRCVVILIHHLSQFNDMQPSPEERCDDTYISLNKQIFVSLHCLTQKENVWPLLSNTNTLSEILKGLKNFYQNSDIIQIIVRLVSKIVDKEDGCCSLLKCPEKLVMVFALILQTHKYNIDIIQQIIFIINNLVLMDNKMAEYFLNKHNLHNILIQILEEYVKEHIQPKRTLSDVFKNSQCDSSGEHDWRHDIFEVISRILCVLANICLNSEAGCSLAQENRTVLHLPNMISAYLKQEVLSDINVPVFSFLIVINNISYYLSPEDTSSLKIAKKIIPLLDDKFSLEVRREAASTIQNLTRSPEVREYIKESSLLPAFIKLLSEDDKEFNAAAYGIIMNLMLDKSNHKIFYKEQGISRILHKLHLSTERDWKTSSMLCKILWNYSKSLNEDSIPISKIEAEHLIKYLSYSTSTKQSFKDETSDSYFTWKNEFCPVAEKLLTLLQSANSSVT